MGLESRSTGVRAIVAGLQVRAAAPMVKRIVLEAGFNLRGNTAQPAWLTSSALLD